MKLSFDPKILIAHRRDKYWTQEDLAAASGVSTRTIQRLERSGGGSLETWKALAAAFEETPEVFLKSVRPSQNTAAENRNAMFGVTIGCLGGLIGCSFGWFGLLQSFEGLQHTLAHNIVELILVTVASAFCLVVPVMTWRHLQDQSP